MVRVLFVCLGNICRSPLAEALLAHKIHQRQLTHRLATDSAGTGNYHLGDLPDPRARQVAATHGLTLTHRARQLVTQDFASFDYILALDKANLDDILALQQRAQRTACRVQLARDFDPTPDSPSVPDPYYGTTDDFEAVYQILDRCTTAFLDSLPA